MEKNQWKPIMELAIKTEFKISILCFSFNYFVFLFRYCHWNDHRYFIHHCSLLFDSEEKKKRVSIATFLKKLSQGAVVCTYVLIFCWLRQDSHGFEACLSHRIIPGLKQTKQN